MLRGTKSLSELLRENLTMTCIRGCLLHHCGNPPEAAGHPARASNPHVALGTSQLTNHHRHRWAVPRGATLWPHRASFSPNPRGLQASNKKFLLFLFQIQNNSTQGPSGTKASPGEGQRRVAGVVGEWGAGLLLQSLGWAGAAPAHLRANPAQSGQLPAGQGRLPAPRRPAEAPSCSTALAILASSC